MRRDHCFYTNVASDGVRAADHCDVELLRRSSWLLMAHPSKKPKLLGEDPTSNGGDSNSTKNGVHTNGESDITHLDLQRNCPYLPTVNRMLLDFDFEKVCSVTLTNLNVYACLVCGKYFQGETMLSFPRSPSVC